MKAIYEFGPGRADGDGRISRAELPWRLGVVVSRGQPSFNSPFLRRAAPPAKKWPLVHQPPVAPRWFWKMDVNRDGEVSRREFLGSDEDFRRIDTNGDGLIDAAEASEADRWFRRRLPQGLRDRLLPILGVHALTPLVKSL